MRKRRKVEVKAWALICGDIIQHDVNQIHKAYGNMYIFREDNKESLEKCIINPFQDEKIVPCTITYYLPKRKGKK